MRGSSAAATPHSDTARTTPPTFKGRLAFIGVLPTDWGQGRVDWSAGGRPPPPKGRLRAGVSPAVLLVAHVFEPIDDLAVERLLDGDVRHGRRRRGPVPVPHAGREPDHVAGVDLLDRAPFLLDPAATGR